MSITDELRTGGIYRFPSNRRVFTEEELTAIADRIDAEHERAMAAAALIAGVPMTDENMAEHGWIRLPVDADGEYIHVGDEMDPISPEYDSFSVVFMILDSAGHWEVNTDLDGEWSWDELNQLRHHAPTVEDVLTEMVAKLVEGGGLSNGAAATFAEDAAKLQLRGVGE